MRPRFYNGSRFLNTLLPQAYDTAWTGRSGIFGAGIPGGIYASVTGGAPASSSASSTAAPAAAGTTGGIGPNSDGAVMADNPRRACLIIQNTSAAGGPVLWYAFGQIAVPNAQGSFALTPGSGLVIADAESCPKESLYIAWSGAGTQLGAWYQNTLPAPPASASSAPLGFQSNLGVQAGYIPQRTIPAGTIVNGGPSSGGFVSG